MVDNFYNNKLIDLDLKKLYWCWMFNMKYIIGFKINIYIFGFWEDVIIFELFFLIFWLDMD